MTKKICFFLFISFVSIFFTSAYAVDFDVRQANKKLDSLSLKLSLETKNTLQLKTAMGVLSFLQEEAKLCVGSAKEMLGDLGRQVKPQAGVEAENISSYDQYLKQKKRILKERESACKLFVLRSDEALNAYSNTLNHLMAKQLLTTKKTFFEHLFFGDNLFKRATQQFDVKLFKAESGYQSISAINGLLFIIILVLGFFLGEYVRKKQLTLVRSVDIETYSDQIKLVLHHVAAKYVRWLMIVGVVLLYAVMLSVASGTLFYFASIAIGFFVLLLSFCFCDLFFKPFQAGCALSDISDQMGELLIHRLKWLSFISLFGFSVYVIFQHQVMPEGALYLLRTSFITLLTISVISVLWTVMRAPLFFRQHRIMGMALNFLMTCLLVALIVLEWLGYQMLVTYVLRGILLSIAAGFAAWLVNKVVIILAHAITSNELPWHKSIYDQLGLKRHEPLPELFWLRVIILFLIWGGFLLMLVKIWAFSSASFDDVLDVVMEGFRIGHAHIVPSRIFFATLFFTIFFLFIRWMRHFVERREGEGIEPASQQAIAAIVAYVSTAIVLLIALVIAGVNFAGLAIIAGALSVGIGFGLQGIFNNCLSGLVLLIERPIKPGDRVVIDGLEGFVKKINIRSTQIETLDFADEIIPNSDIISKKVTNMMLHDFYGRVRIEVGVAYGSDTALVKKVLLEVAQEHPEVLSDDKLRKSIVLFRAFGENSLNFMLACVIKNVNLKYPVMSELHFAIDQKFRENGIVIAFPQQDIHIKEWVNPEKG